MIDPRDIEDLKASIDALTAALGKALQRPDPPAPNVTVEAPAGKAPDVVVNSNPKVTVPPIKVPKPTVEIHERDRKFTVSITKRDENGLIETFTIEPS